MATQKNDSSGWVEAVAKRAKLPAAKAEQLLEALQIHPSPHLPRPRSLRLQQLQFSGRKAVDGVETPIAFEWPLDAGVHCLASDGNLVGKSSVLRTILWALRGEPRALQADVRTWIRNVDLTFAIDGVRHRVTFATGDGTVSGEVRRGNGKSPPRIAHFRDEREFATCMDEIMLDALGLDRIPSWQSFAGSQDGRVVTHAWPAYSGALVIAEAAHKVLLGETEQAGLPGRLLQMFMGLPWASTAAAAKAKDNELSQRVRNATRRREEDAAVRGGEERELKAKIETARQALARIGDDAPAVAAAQAAFTALSAAQEALLASARELEAARVDVEAARKRRLEDQGRLQDAEESQLARRFFDALDPSCCPRCDTAIGAERRKREKTEDACAICASPLGVEEADETALELLRAAARASGDAEDAAKKRFDAASAAHEQRGAILAAARETHNTARVTVEGLRERRTIEIEIARLEGALEERTRTQTAVASAASGEAERDAAAVAHAASEEASARAKAAADGIFSALNDEVCHLAQAFGMPGLSAVKLDRAGHLTATKGGQSTAFSHLTAGERLRLRVATTAGLLRVAKLHGVGRHPGVLLLDSPGSEEVKGEDAAELVRELVRVAEEIGEFQVLVTTARPDVVAQALPPERVRVIARGKYAW